MFPASGSQMRFRRNLTAARDRIKIERLAKVVDEVLCSLDPDGNTDQGIGNPQPPAFFPWYPDMSRCCRKRYQGFDTSQAGSDQRQFQLLDERIRGLQSTFGLEAQHSTKPREQTLGPFMMRVTLQTWMGDPRYCRMTFQEAGNFQGTSVLMVEPQDQRLQPAVE